MVSEEFKNNVESGSVIRVRSALVDYLIIDKTFRKFDDALAEAEKSLDVLEEHDGKPFIDDETKWTEEYLNDLKVDLMVNFSEKRINHLKQVIKVVLKEKTVLKENTSNDKLRDVKTVSVSSRTGRKVVAEEEVKKLNSSVNSAKMNNGCNSGTRTGKRTISEKVTHIEKEDDKEHEKVDVVLMTIGGVSILVGSGMAIAGVGASYAVMAGGAVVAGVGAYDKWGKK